jgi:hypothetical protein
LNRWRTKASPTGRSAVSNRKRLLPKVGTGAKSDLRRWHDLVYDLARELGRDPSEAELAIIKTVATTTLASEFIQAKVVARTATASEVSELARLSNVQLRGLQQLGVRKGRGNGRGYALRDHIAKGDA